MKKEILIFVIALCSFSLAAKKTKSFTFNDSNPAKAPRIFKYHYVVKNKQEVRNINASVGEKIYNESNKAVWKVRTKIEISLLKLPVDDFSVIAMENGYFATIDYEDLDFISVTWFGADPTDSNDDTTSIQNTIDFAYIVEGGVVYLPNSTVIIPSDTVTISTKGMYRITDVNVYGGIMVKGDGKGAVTHQGNIIHHGNTAVKVTEGGQGFIIGQKQHVEGYIHRGMQIKDLYIEGDSTARSGVRIGSDSSYYPVAAIKLENLRISGFTNDTILQKVYDKTSTNLGQGQSNFSGALPFSGACGIFAASGVSVHIDNVEVSKNYIGVGESGARNATTYSFYKCYISNNTIGVKLLSAIHWRFEGATIIESNKGPAVESIVPKITTGTDLYALAIGPRHIFFDGVHMEQNNFADTTRNSYDIVVDNKNIDVETRSWYFINSNIGFTGHGFSFKNVDKFFIRNNSNVSINSDKILINVDNTSDSLNKQSKVNVYYEGNIRKGAIIADNSLELKQVLGHSQGSLSYLNGGLVGMHKTWSMKNALGAIDPSQNNSIAQWQNWTNILNGSDAVIWSANNVVNPNDTGVIKLVVSGYFSDDYSVTQNDTIEKDLRILIGSNLIIMNESFKKATNEAWIANIYLRRLNNNTAIYNATLQIGDKLEPIKRGTISDTDFWAKEHRIYVQAKLSQNTPPSCAPNNLFWCNWLSSNNINILSDGVFANYFTNLD